MSDTQRILLVSEKHRRFENGILTRDEVAYRTIDLLISNGGKLLVISINPTLTAKPAFAQGGRGEYVVYKGQDPDLEFHLKINDVKNTIDEVRLFRLDKNLELRYATRIPDKNESIIRGV